MGLALHSYEVAKLAEPPPSRVSPAAKEGPRSDRVSAPAVRRIIYNATVDLVVESITNASQALASLVKESGGYLAETDVSSHAQSRRYATWKVRVPVERFEAFLAAVERLGELQDRHLDSQDVTQEYVDLEAQIANKQQEEKRLLKHLAESTGKLAEILAVEKELSRVRGEVELFQGRIRYLGHLSALSTVTIRASELRDYTPPISASFTTQIGRTFRTSLSSLIAFGKACVLVVVAITPWLPLLLMLAFSVVWLLRRVRRTGRTWSPE